MIRVLPRWRTAADTGDVTLAERLANLYRIYFVSPKHWPKSDRHVAVGWRPDETWEPIGNGEYAKPIHRGDK